MSREDDLSSERVLQGRFGEEQLCLGVLRRMVDRETGMFLSVQPTAAAGSGGGGGAAAKGITDGFRDPPPLKLNLALNLQMYHY